MIRSRNVQESCGATALSRWQSLCLKKEAFKVVRLCKPCLSLMGSHVSLGYDSLRLQGLCFNFEPRTRRKEQPLPPIPHAVHTKIASLMLQYVNAGTGRLPTPA